MLERDEYQEKAVNNDEYDSILVAAGAGTGKTEVMTRRIVRLVEKIYDDAARVTARPESDTASPMRDITPELSGISSFLVLTFTKAATDEMKGRIESKLRSRANDISLDPQKREYLLNQAAAVDGAHIQTFHSFCYDIVREFHHLGKNYDPDAYILSDAERGELLGAAFDDVLKSGELPDTAAALYKLWDKQGQATRLKEATLRLIGFAENSMDFDAALDAVNLYSPRNADRLAEAAEILLNSYEKDIYNLVSEYSDAVAALKSRLNALEGARSDDKIESVLKAALKYAGKCTDHINEIERRTLAALVSAKRAYGIGSPLSGTAADVPEKTLRHPTVPKHADVLEMSPPLSEISDHLKAQNKKLTDIGKTLTKMAEASDSERYCELADALIELAKRVKIAFQDAKQRRGAIDFADQEHFAYELLHSAEHAEIFETVASRLKYIFVDENQDTSIVQDAIVDRVASGGAKIFRVGDVKQCIYAFRNADPGIFKARLDAAGELDANCEHSSACANDTIRIPLNSNYRTVAPLLAYINEVFRVGMPELYNGADLVSGRKKSDDRKASDVVRFYVTTLAEDRGIPKDEAQAEIVAREILQKVASGARYSDFAILFRALTGAVLPYQRVFEKYGIPLEVQSEGSYTDIPELSLVLATIAGIFNPCCDADFVAAATSPFFYMSLDDFAQLASGKAYGMSYYDLCMKIQNSKTIEKGLSERISATLEEMRWLRGYSHYMKPAEFIWKLYAQRGFFDSLDEREPSKANLANFAMKLSALPAEMSIFDYAESLRKKDVKNEGALIEGTNTVKLMTIHHSKGMGFKNVFCVNLQKKLLKNTSGYVLAPKAGFAFAATSVWDVVQPLLQLQEMEESMRVLYVAFTRAKETLTLVSDESRKRTNSYYDFLTNKDFSILPEPYLYDELPVLSSDGPEDADMLPAIEFNPEKAALEQISDSTLIADPNFTKARTADFLERNYALEYGRARHRELELFDFSILLSDEDAKSGRRTYSENKSIDNFLRSDIALRAARAKRIFKEVEYVSFGERGKDQGVIDLYFVEDDGGIVLVDYKTDIFESEADVENIKSRYSAQLARYCRVLEQNYGAPVKEVYLCLLHGDGRCVCTFVNDVRLF